MKKLLTVLLSLVIPIVVTAEGSVYTWDCIGIQLINQLPWYNLQIAQYDAKAKVTVMGTGVEDITKPKSDEPFKLNGNVELRAQGNQKDGEGAEIRQESESIYETVVGLNVGYKGYDGKAKLYLTSEDETDAQRRHKLELDMTTPWGAINFGDQVVSHSNLTLNGQRITGAEVGLEINKQELSIFGGQATKAIEAFGTYARNIGGVRGKASIADKYAINLIYLTGSDDKESLDSSNQAAYKSGVFGIGAEADLLNSLTVNIELASSTTEKTTKQDATEELNETAIRSELRYDNQTIQASIGYSHIPNNYFSIGNPYLLDNLETYAFKLGSYFQQQKYFASVDLDIENAIDTSEYKGATRIRFGFDFQARPGGAFPNIYINMKRTGSGIELGQKQLWNKEYDDYAFSINDNLSIRLNKGFKSGKVNHNATLSYSLYASNQTSSLQSHETTNDNFKLTWNANHQSGLSGSVNLGYSNRDYSGTKSNQNDAAVRFDWRPISKNYSLFVLAGLTNSDLYSRTNGGAGLTWNLTKNQTFELSADATNYDDDDDTRDYNLMNWRSVYRYSF